jgi:hypothetical protein
MASPFPGMNPYLEMPAHWPDFHATFINDAREALLQTLPSHYTARIGERVYLIEGPPPVRNLTVPDVAVVLEEPIETYIEILHRSDRSLVTILEVLSPANKEEPGRGAYLAKRNALLRKKVHLVELDFLRAGKRLPLRAELPSGDYYAFIARAEQRPNCQVYSWALAEPLPVLPIPLRAPDPDAWLDVGAVFAVAFERGDYEPEIDTAMPPPGLNDEQRQWVEECLRQQGSP